MRLRKLHRGHFAFMRAVIQGLDTRDSWQRYLRIEGEHDDIRNVRRTITWIRDEFAAAARRHDRFGTARLVQVDMYQLINGESVFPTLSTFAAEHGIEDFSEKEQIERYKQVFGSATERQARRAAARIASYRLSLRPRPSRVHKPRQRP